MQLSLSLLLQKKKKNWTKTCVPRSLKYSALHLQKLGIFSLSSHSPSLFPPPPSPPDIIALPFVSAPEVEKQSGFMRFSSSDCLKVCHKNKQTNKRCSMTERTTVWFLPFHRRQQFVSWMLSRWTPVSVVKDEVDVAEIWFSCRS